MSSAIKDIQEFSRLFRVRIPYDAEFDYYIETMAKSPEFSHLPALVEEFAEFEKWVRTVNLYPGSYKMEMLRKIKDYIVDTDSYARFFDAPYTVMGNKQDSLSTHDGRYLISFDLRKANYAVLKSFDKRNELPSQWSELVEEMKIHPIMAKSKVWRQLVFGGLDPKQSQRCQNAFMLGFWDRLADAGISENDRILFSPDEIVINAGKLKTVVKRNFSNMEAIAAEAHDPEALPQVPAPFRGNMDIRVRIFRLVSLESGMYIREELDGDLNVKYKSLYGVPGNRFFIEFKKHILEAPLEDPDLYFINEHKLAKWVMDHKGNHLK